MKTRNRLVTFGACIAIIAFDALLMATPACADPTPTKGACCLAGGVCSQLTPSACKEAGGSFRGLATSCRTESCSGACCFPGTGSCSVITEARCTTSGGVYEGDGTICAGVSCVPVQACCLLDGSCLMETSTACRLEHTGVAQGAETTCASVTCPDESGEPDKFACCLGGGVCQEMTADNCAAQGGLTEDGTCLDVICFGACCFSGSQTCDLRPLNLCRAAGGAFQGNGTLCAGGCDPMVGACCQFLAECIVVSPADCAALGADFQGLGTDCGFPFGSPCPVGACCLNQPGLGGDCLFLTEDECAKEPNSSFQGVGSSCEDCEGPTGACCTAFASGASCVMRTSNECEINGDVFQGAGTSCEQEINAGLAVCPQGACCFTEGLGPAPCSTNTPANCADQGGVYQGNESECIDDFDCPYGACCLNIGCENDVLPLDCAEANGDFQGAGSTCGGGGGGMTTIGTPCPVGACCDGEALLGATCSVARPSECTSIGGAYQGNGTSCDTLGGTCVPGACCLGSMASSGPIDCAVMTEAECEARPDAVSFAGPGTTCTKGTCAPPSCVGDLDESGTVDFNDLLIILNAWGPCTGCPADLTMDGEVGFADLLIVISAYDSTCIPE